MLSRECVTFLEKKKLVTCFCPSQLTRINHYSGDEDGSGTHIWSDRAISAGDGILHGLQ